ncbi:MAG: F0F1 ATP synthase subunit delta [Thermoleophilia bacterium]|nr:F0F1 ATP synthase subunit delta [Thermoleophilia bacterium]
MSQTRIARVYAGALYEAALEGGKVDAVRKDLTAFVDALGQSAELRALLLDEQMPGEQKKKVLMQLTEGGRAWSATSCACSWTNAAKRHWSRPIDSLSSGPRPRPAW